MQIQLDPRVFEYIFCEVELGSSIDFIRNHITPRLAQVQIQVHEDLFQSNSGPDIDLSLL